LVKDAKGLSPIQIKEHPSPWLPCWLQGFG
jgi:hypothetical protein